ncbi:MMPL family transporter [Methylomonas sp. MED-D]|uniref:MMPL family transporter n=1 Tax=unclassified Methylomonas TaxID=2608980 RepID=UPI003D078B18
MNVYRPRLYALIWCLAMTALAWQAARDWSRDWLETGFMALLPVAEQRPDVAEAIAARNRQIQGKLIWLAGAASADQAVAAIRQVHRELAASGLFASLPLERAADVAAPAYRRWFDYRYQLLDDATRQTLSQDPAKIAAENLAWLYSPVGQLQTAGLERDPWLLFNRYLRARQPLAASLHQGVPLIKRDGRYWALLIGEWPDSDLKLDKLGTLLSLNQRLTGQIAEQGGELLATGMPLFTAHGSHSAQQEMSLIGGGSTLGLLILLWAAFRGPRPLLLSCLAVAAGLFAAWVLSLQLFGKLHILTLVFGSSLVGVVVDYALHFFCDGMGLPDWTPRQGLAYVLPGIGFGLLTSLLGYAGLGWSPFPGLREIAAFSAIGLIVSWLTVVAVFPSLLGGFRMPHRPAVLRLTRYWQQVWPGWLNRHRIALALSLAVLLVGGLTQLQPKDDVRLLQSAPTSLLAADAKLKQVLAIGYDSQFFLVSGADQTEWLANEHRLLAGLNGIRGQGGLAGYDAISAAWPDPERQRADYRLLQTTLYDNVRLKTYMTGLGFSAQAAAEEARQFVAAEARVLPLADWLAAADPGQRGLWLGCDVGACRSVVALSGVADLAGLAAAQNLPGVAWVDQAGQMSALFARYRAMVTGLLLGVCGLLLAALVFKLGWRSGLQVMAVPAVAMAAALAILGWRGELFTLFNLFALMLVLEVGVDYAVFFHLAGSERRDSTGLAVTLSAFSTLLAYGLLALSSTAIVHAFGLTLAVGITTAFLLAPLVGFSARPSRI